MTSARVPGGANCDFNDTGFRVSLIVTAPFAKKNYVSHTVTDYTAMLKLIETRFGIPPVTKRDAAQMDMTEVLDFKNVPWDVAPSPADRAVDGTCDYRKLK